MTLAQKYVVTELQAVKSLFLFYQNAAALLLFIPSSAGWLSRFGIKPCAPPPPPRPLPRSSPPVCGLRALRLAPRSADPPPSAEGVHSITIFIY
jgi:hypothetical protein